MGPPDFVGVGVQRAGTSWWWNLVTQHPQVHVPGAGTTEFKERQFFSGAYAPRVRERQIERYPLDFPRPPGTLTGEWTPRYMYDPWTPRALATAAPSARVLVMLRDPVERCQSALAWIARRLGGEQEVKRELRNEAVARGLYGAQLHLLLAHFAARQVLVLQYERCLREPALELARTFRFLGLEPMDSMPAHPHRPRRSRRAASVQLSPETRADLVALYAPDIDSLTRRFPDVDVELWPNFAHRPSGDQDRRL